VQAIIKADIVPRLLQLLATDELMRWKVAKVIKYITRGNAPQIEYSHPPPTSRRRHDHYHLHIPPPATRGNE
jgi:hypothetical protein